MSTNPLPPQAYTKETLIKAYAWLQTQNDSIKQMATNPDLLVSLYLKAKLNGDAALERPSIQNFKNDLKNLAGMMDEFEPAMTPPATPLPPPQATAPHPILEPKSLSMIREVKEAFNLSSDQESLRFLISVGYKKSKALLD